MKMKNIYNAMVTAQDVIDEEKNIAEIIFHHYEGIAQDDGSLVTRKKLATQIYNAYGSYTGNTIYVEVIGNGTAYVSDNHPLDNDDFILYAIPYGTDTLVSPDGITATTSSGQYIALLQQESQTIRYDPLWGKFINIRVEFTGDTPPIPPIPPLPPVIRNRKHHMPIWEYPSVKRRKTWQNYHPKIL